MTKSVTKKTKAKKLNKWLKFRAFILSVFVPLAVFVVSQLFVFLLFSLFIPGLIDGDVELTTFQTFIYAVCFEVLALVLVWQILRRRKLGLKWIGISGPPNAKNMFLVLPAAGVYIMLAVASFVFLEALNTGVDLDQEQVVGFESASGSVELLMAFVALVVLTPITEEVLMRGIMFRNLKRWFGFVFAAVVSAFIFGVLHGQVNVFLDTFVLGLVLAWLVDKTDSLWPAIGLHMLKNGIAFSYLFVF